MPCYFPLLAMKDDLYKTVDIIGSFREDYQDKTWNLLTESNRRDIREHAIERWHFMRKGRSAHSKLIELPCGKCIGCRLEYSRTWANRNVLESLMHPEGSNWFFTLTLDDSHLVFGREGFATTVLDDLTAFMKALRQHWSKVHGVDSGIRFYGTNEYGDESMRPHYHVLIFGCPLFDLEYYKTTENGDILYKSKELDHIWQKGFVTVAEFNWNTAAYTSRYVMKKANGIDSDSYVALDIEPEKPRMSRRPGIARSFYEAHFGSIYDLDEIVLPSGNNGSLKVVSPPRYFDEILKRDDPSLYEKIKADRERLQKLRKEVNEQKQGYDPLELLNHQLKDKTEKLCIFKRNL